MIRSTTNHAILWRAVPHQDKLEREAAMMGQGRLCMYLLYLHRMDPFWATSRSTNYR